MRPIKIFLITIAGFLFGGFLGGVIALIFALTYIRRNHDVWFLPKLPDFTELNRDKNNQKSAGDYGETLMREELIKLKGKTINGYISMENILFQK